MNEKPILFSGPMVRAILSGQKTQTRRVMKIQPPVEDRRHRWAITVRGGECAWGRDPWYKSDPMNHLVEGRCRCTFGAAGTNLWVKETHCPGAGLAKCSSADLALSVMAPAGSAPAPEVIYRADGAVLPAGVKWRPSIFMRRAYSRINLLVTDIRVERLQDITEADAQAEGCPGDEDTHPLTEYEALWEEINGSESWTLNPWVWVVSFKRVTP
jgi:hypothetical protein